MNSYEGFSTEDLQHCRQDVYSGIKTRIYYVPANFISICSLPSEGGFEESMVIQEQFLRLREGLTWAYMDALIDENDFGLNIAGNSRRKKMETNLNVFILGVKAKIVGFIEQFQNTPMLFILSDSNDNNWLIGTLRNPALFSKADGTSGKKYEDNSGVSISISAKSALYRYAGVIDAGEDGGGDDDGTIRFGGFIDLTPTQ